MFGGRDLRKTVGIPMSTKCAPIFVHLFFRSYETDFIQELLKKKLKRSKPDPFTIRNIQYVLSLTNSKFRDYIRCIHSVLLRNFIS